MLSFSFKYGKNGITGLFLVIFLVFGVQASGFDRSRYIGIDEITPPMDAYCLTVLEGTKIEKFPLKVLSVVKNHRPNTDMLLVMGTDERFIHSGPVKGCSGSPVYIDGRLAGALAIMFNGSIDPLYLATPIEYMLSIPEAVGGAGDRVGSVHIDFSKPIDLASVSITGAGGNANGFVQPLFTSLPAEVCGQLGSRFASMDFIPVTAGGGYEDTVRSEQGSPFQPGSLITIPLSRGDVSLSAAGTVTEVVGDMVYAFGHQFQGIGEVELPMATGSVHTVVASRNASFKLSSAGETLGAVIYDQSTGICGVIGKEARTIPLTIVVDHFHDTVERKYECVLVSDRVYTSTVLQAGILGACQMKGMLPPEHTVEYEGAVYVNGFEPLRYKNVSSQQDLMELVMHAANPVTMLMNNPYEKVGIERIECKVKLLPVSKQSVIYSARVLDSSVKAGETIKLDVTLQSHFSKKRNYRIEFEIPKDTKTGKYQITLAGADEYESFVRKARPRNFRAIDLASLVEGLQNILDIRKDRLYAVMQLPPGGVTIERTELPELPGTKSLLMQDGKRTVATSPYNRWVQKEVVTDWVVRGGRTLDITVED